MSVFSLEQFQHSSSWNVLLNYQINSRHALYQVVVKNAEQAVSVNGLENEIPVDVFAYANTGRAGQIRVPKDQKMKFEAILTLMDVEYSILTENIKE